MSPKERVLNFSLACTVLILAGVVLSVEFLLEGRMSRVLLCLCAVTGLFRLDRWFRKRHEEVRPKPDEGSA